MDGDRITSTDYPRAVRVADFMNWMLKDDERLAKIAAADGQFNAKREKQREEGNARTTREEIGNRLADHWFNRLPHKDVCDLCGASREQVIDSLVLKCTPTAKYSPKLCAAMSVPCNDGWRDRRITASYEGAVRDD